MTKISTTQKSPIKISVVKSKSYFWCSCGFSKTQPFCDGSHKDTGKSPLKFVAIILPSGSSNNVCGMP